MKIAERVLRTVRKHGLIEPGGRVVAALSGGPDSVALVHLLLELQRAGNLTVAGVAHFNHQLRGDEAAADEAFCVAMAAELCLPIEIGRGDVRAIADAEGRSIEDAARMMRYAFLEEAGDRLAARSIAVGHSRDDQAETFLLRLIRGAGPRGLAGILPRNGRIVRPLLEVRRSELRQYAADHQLVSREDATNADVRIPRNRVRHELLPLLEREFSPGITDVLAREADIAREDEDYLARQAIDLTTLIVLTKEAARTAGPGAPPIVHVDAAALSLLHPALATRVARQALTTATAGGFVGFDQIARFLAFAREARPGQALSLPGLQAVRDVSGVVLGPEPPRGTAARVSNSFRFPLSIPGEVTLDTQGWIISAGLATGMEPDPPHRVTVGSDAILVRADTLALPLSVRSRVPGDRLRLAGTGGRGRKLQDLFVDRKIPRQIRDSVPLIVDGNDRIVWVVGEAVAADFRVTEPSQGVIFLKARRLGGLG
jgi:tRNA(Ile)-lysidine synthase